MLVPMWSDETLRQGPIALERALFCLDCEVIFTDHACCPSCSGRVVWPLATWLSPGAPRPSVASLPAGGPPVSDRHAEDTRAVTEAGSSARPARGTTDQGHARTGRHGRPQGDAVVGTPAAGETPQGAPAVRSPGLMRSDHGLGDSTARLTRGAACTTTISDAHLPHLPAPHRWRTICRSSC
jgi:hypothetical protein